MLYLFVFAHPDDESFSSGGTIRKLVNAGHTVKLITATRGEAGLVGDPPVTTKQRLPQAREQELRTAAKLLGISEIYFLDLIDGTLHRESLSKLVRMVYEFIKDEQPDVVVTFGKEGSSKHPDHVTIGKAATKAFYKYMEDASKHVRLYHTVVPRGYIKKLQKEGNMFYTFGEVKGTPESEITTVVHIDDTEAAKLEAIKSHRTQHQDWEKYVKRELHQEHHCEHFILIAENTLG